MTSTSHLYENFAFPPDPPDDQTGGLSEEEIEDSKLASFEAGYSSGWEDAVRAHEESKSAITAALREGLERAELSRDAAFDQFIASAETLIDGIVKQVLPALSQDVLGYHIRDILSGVVHKAMDQTIEISVSPADHDSLARLSAEWLPQTARIVSDPGLSPGQADLKLADGETHVDLAEVIAEVGRAVDAFFHVAKETSAHAR